MSTRRVVVTGARGFVGRVLVARLLREPDLEVIAVGRQANDSSHRLVQVAADLSEWGWTAHLPAGADIVLHLAQSSQYQRFPDGEPDIVRVNVDSTAELADWSRLNGVRHFLFTSSGSVYASAPGAANEESACKAVGIYAVTKFAAEQIALCYAGLFPVTIVRVSNVYGPHQSRGLFRTLNDRLKSGERVTVAAGTGTHLTPIFVDDCADALARLAVRPLPGTGPEIYNLGGREVSHVRAIVEEMAALGCGTPRFENVEGDAVRLVADSAKLYAALNWLPPTALKAGIASMVDSMAMRRSTTG